MHDSDSQGIQPKKTSCLENKLAEKIVPSEDGINRAFEAMVTKNLSSRVFETSVLKLRSQEKTKANEDRVVPPEEGRFKKEKDERGN